MRDVSVRVWFADISGYGCVTCKDKKGEDRRTKKRFHGESLLFFSLEIFKSFDLGGAFRAF